MGRASRRKRERARDPDSPEHRLAARITARYDNVSFRPSKDRPPGLPPLSERLTVLIAPYRDEAKTLHAYRALTTMAVLAWNLCLRPEANHERYIAKAVVRADLPDPGIFRGIVSDLMQRKKQLFPDDARLIAGHEVSPTNDCFHLVVASTDLRAV
jgi:hypothetical protein